MKDYGLVEYRRNLQGLEAQNTNVLWYVNVVLLPVRIIQATIVFDNTKSFNNV